MENGNMNDMSNYELVKQLLTAFNSFKEKLEDPNYVQLEMSIRQMMEAQKEMKEDITELKRQLLNPYDGVIVETQKNTAHRKEAMAFEIEWNKMIEEHRSLVKWKANLQKVSVAILTSAGAVIAWVLSEFVLKK